MYDKTVTGRKLDINKVSPESIKLLSPSSLKRFLKQNSVQLQVKEDLLANRVSSSSRSLSPIQTKRSRKRIVDLDTSMDTLDISLQSMGTPLCDETVLEGDTPQFDVSILCDETPLDLSRSSIPVSQLDLFSSSAPVEQRFHIPVRDISLPGTRLPPLQSAHYISPLVRSSSESVVGSQSNIFGSQCAFSPNIVQPTVTKKVKKKSIFPFNVELIDRGTSSPQVTDYTCSPEFSTISRLLGQQNEILPFRNFD